MNHYAIKSMDAFSLRKYRGNANLKKDKYNSDYWALQDRNEVQDLVDPEAYSSAIRNNGDFVGGPRVGAPTQCGPRTGRKRPLKDYHEQEAYQEYVAQLVEASKIPYTEVVAKPSKTARSGPHCCCAILR
jgi:hypothetical protein